jgi:hypothetical protein
MKETSKRKERPGLPKVDDEMRQLCGLISAELKKWPDVTSRHMFGMLSFYREVSHFPQPKIFACIPDKRALSSARAIAFKLEKPTQAHLARMKAEARIATPAIAAHAKWLEFSLTAPGDIHEALWWLEQAYKSSKNK